MLKYVDVCVRGVMDVFFVCIVIRGAVGARVWEVLVFRHADVCLCRVHPVAILNVAFCMTCSLLMLVEDTRGNHMEEAYSRAGLMTAL